jgi:5-methylcytosine-specific restriction enzyme A
MEYRGQVLFCPSRFVGYIGNTRSLHLAFPFKDGKETTPHLNASLQIKLVEDDPRVEATYLALCDKLNLGVPKRPLRKGSRTEIRPRAYWIISDNYDLLQMPNPIWVDARNPDEVEEDDTFAVGAVTHVFVNRYERDPAARSACIDHYGGAKCQICRINFGQAYGEFGMDYIHVHHLYPKTLRQEGYKIDPTTELIPVCPNCHAMLHYRSPIDRPWTPDELRVRIASTRLANR